MLRKTQLYTYSNTRHAYNGQYNHDLVIVIISWPIINTTMIMRSNIIQYRESFVTTDNEKFCRHLLAIPSTDILTQQ